MVSCGAPSGSQSLTWRLLMALAVDGQTTLDEIAKLSFPPKLRNFDQENMDPTLEPFCKTLSLDSGEEKRK